LLNTLKYSTYSASTLTRKLLKGLETSKHDM